VVTLPLDGSVVERKLNLIIEVIPSNHAPTDNCKTDNIKIFNIH